MRELILLPDVAYTLTGVGDYVVPEVVGGDLALSDDSDASWVKFGTGSSPGVAISRGGGAFTQRLDMPTLTRGKVLARLRVTSDLCTRIPRIGWFEVADMGSAVDPYQALPAGTNWVDIPLKETPAQIATSLVQNETTNLEIMPHNDDPMWSTYWVYEAWVVIQINGGLPPCVQFPRADGLASSSARQHYPRDKSWQTGTRWRGGYY